MSKAQDDADNGFVWGEGCISIHQFANTRINIERLGKPEALSTLRVGDVRAFVETQHSKTFFLHLSRITVNMNSILRALPGRRFRLDQKPLCSLKT